MGFGLKSGHVVAGGYPFGIKNILVFWRFGWGLVGVVGRVVLVVPGSYSVLGWAGRMFIWWWEMSSRGGRVVFLLFIWITIYFI